MAQKSLILPRLFTLRLCCWLMLSAFCAGGPDEVPDFTRDVLPLLQSRCFSCHDQQDHNGGLNLESGLLRGGESGPVIVAGQPDQSLLLRLVSEGVMPPEKSDRLSGPEVSLLQRWIAGGARMPGPEQFPTVTWGRIQALLLLRCAVCHGADRQEAGLDLRTPEGLLRGGKSGPAVVAGKPGESLLLQKIASGEMPPVRRLVEVSIKQITPTETQLLHEWIASGMPQDAKDSGPESNIAADARNFWSFQPPKAVLVPVVRDQHRVQTPIDAFILQRLEQQQLTLSPAADQTVLIRRLYLNLTGLPPTWEQLRQVLSDPDPNRISRLIDRLLDSPHYGVRWGRFWLDAAGYADSEGAQNEDRIRREMWRYRDYVIRSFNADKPWDRFLQEQLAGDELADYVNAPEIDQTLYDNLTATGFLRTAPDRTFANITAFVPDRLEVIADEMQILGSAVMGLTIGCARCHSHKFDPIPQADYYRLSAIFRDGFDEHDWLRPEDQRTLPYVTTVERRAWEQQRQMIEQQQSELRARIDKAEGDAKAGLQKELDQLGRTLPPEPRIRALWSRGRPSPAWVLLRGDYLTPGRRVEPGVPEVLCPPDFEFTFEPPWPGAAKTGSRLAFARWLTRPDHPLTARVLVNRIWMHHFGRGLVETPGNFGRTGSRPTHPELLDWLAVEFVRGGWSVKSLHRLILNSAVWQQSSALSGAAAELDPEGRLYSRMPLGRMDAETLRDSLLCTANALSDHMYGPADASEVRSDGLVTVKARDGRWRRSIFALMRRTQIPGLLESFDYPQMGPNCLQRNESLTATQSLQLLNSKEVHDLASCLAADVLREAGQAVPLSSDGAARQHRVELLARRIYCRAPSVPELELLQEGLSDLVQEWERSGELKNGAVSAESAASETAAAAEFRAFENLCHAMLNSAAFSTIE